MGLDDLAHERKPQPGPAVLPGSGTIQLVEWFKDILQPAGWDADAGIGDGGNHQIFAFPFDGYRDTSARRGKFDPVIDELFQHPGDLLRICLNERNVFIDRSLQTDPAPESCLPMGLDRQVCQAADIHISA